MSRDVIIDTDPGVDDALALFLSLSSPELRIRAITTVAGNVPVELTTANAHRILTVARPVPKPPVARGANGPLTRALETASHVHGDDGLGGVSSLRDSTGRLVYPIGDPPPESLGAVETILSLLGESQMTLIAIGPLTNLALAHRRDPVRFSEVRQIIIMGGAVSVPGNVTPAAEFNFYVDPEAAHEILTSDLPVTLIPLDVTRQAILSAAAIRTLGQRGGETGRFIEAFSRVGLAFAQRVERERGITLHDPLAVAAAMAEELFTFEPLSLDVETEDEATRGKVLVSERSGHSHCRVATEVRAEEFLDLFMERLCPGSSSSAARI